MTIVRQGLLTVIFVAGCSSCLMAADEVPATVDLIGQQTPMLRLLERLAQQCEAELLVEGGVATTVLDKVSVEARGVAWDRALRWFRDEHGLELTHTDGQLRVLDHRRLLDEELVWRWYDIRSLHPNLSERWRPIGLGLSAEPGSAAMMVPEIADEGVADVDNVLEVVERSIVSSDWVAGTSLDLVEGTMLVRQTADVHGRIDRLLARLETSLYQQVMVRCWQLPDDAVPAGPVLDPATWRSMRAGLSVPMLAKLLVGGSQDVLGSVRSYERLVDYDVVGNALDGIMTAYTGGLLIEIRVTPTVAGLVTDCDMLWVDLADDEPAELVVGEDRLVMQRMRSDERRVAGTRTIPAGGAGIYRLGDRLLAVELELVDAPADERE